MSKLPTVEETKRKVAAEYGCDDYKHDYEYGLGISKLMDPFEFMDRVCESHTAAHTAALDKYNSILIEEKRELMEKVVALESGETELQELFELRVRVKELEDKITKLQEKYDENGCDLNPVIKLQRIESHIDASFEILNKRLSVLENMLSLSESSKSKISEDNESKNIRISQLESLMQEFVDRVDRGEVRSKKTYAKFKEVLK